MRRWEMADVVEYGEVRRIEDRVVPFIVNEISEK